MRWHDTAFRLPMKTYLSHTSHDYEDMHEVGLIPYFTHGNGGVLLDRFCSCSTVVALESKEGLP
jgi:hypothetical protein